MAEMWDEEFRNLVFKVSSDLKGDSNKQMTKVNKPTQNLDKKFNNLYKKFKIQRFENPENLEMKSWASQINNAMEWYNDIMEWCNGMIQWCDGMIQWCNRMMQWNDTMIHWNDAMDAMMQEEVSQVN